MHSLVLAVSACKTFDDILTGHADALEAAGDARADADAAAEKEFDEEAAARRAQGLADESALLAECGLASTEVWSPLVDVLGPAFAPRDEGEDGAVAEEEAHEDEDGEGDEPAVPKKQKPKRAQPKKPAAAAAAAASAGAPQSSVSVPAALDDERAQEAFAALEDAARHHDTAALVRAISRAKASAKRASDADAAVLGRAIDIASVRLVRFKSEDDVADLAAEFTADFEKRALAFERDAIAARLRPVCLGSDRASRSYWLLPGDLSRVFVQIPPPPQRVFTAAIAHGGASASERARLAAAAAAEAALRFERGLSAALQGSVGASAAAVGAVAPGLAKRAAPVALPRGDDPSGPDAPPPDLGAVKEPKKRRAGGGAPGGGGASKHDDDREDGLARLRAELPGAAGPALGLVAAFSGDG